MKRFLLFHNLYRYRRYIFYNAWNELHLRYAGTGMGIFWNLIHPLCEIIIYTIVFSLLISRGTQGHSYALYLTSGLLPWRTFADAIAQGSSAFTQNATYLKRLAIPPEIFVAKVAVTSLLLLFVYLVLLLPLSAVFGGHIGLGILLLPLLAILLQGLGFGMELALANLQTLFPDIRQILQFLIPLWSWTMPIFYPDTVIPKSIQPFLYLNPPYAFIESIRYVILENRLSGIQSWTIMAAWITLFLWLGITVNENLQDDVRDVV
ncbi:MAG: ABC transporter permease [Leptolyngbyaceae cyanobacterium bins.302]|nr:ABC transporter permease [Leptolyngbyaceae cyanobacterium bins.302]